MSQTSRSALYRAIFALTFALPLAAQTSPLIDILSKELDRNFQVLKSKADPAVYFLAYAVSDIDSRSVTATSGSILSQGANHARALDVTLRAGSPELDNYRRVQGDFPRFTSGALISLDDNAAAIQQKIWAETDRCYRSAAQRLIRIKTNNQVKVQSTDTSGDFSPAEKVVSISKVPQLDWNEASWSTRARKLSAEFNKFSYVLASNVTIMAQREVKVLTNSEGTQLQHGRIYARIFITARAKASDGMDLFLSDSFEADSPDKLPKDEVVLASIRKVATDLGNLLKAPEVEPFVGPAILSGRASGVFFHEIFGHRVEGHRQKDETEGQTFTKSVGTKVLPDFLSVVFDPTKRTNNNTDLYGWYDFDDEGVKARPVTVVDNGTLKTFLLSRSPIEGFPSSNGHGRRQAGTEVVARQSNLLVQSGKQVSDKELREMLIAELKRQNKPYGLLFDHVTGGYTTTGRRGLQAFTVMPLVVYRVYADGKPDELVRGADIVGTPLASFAKILATSNRTEIFNGYCGAESGNVPVAAVSPAILVSEIEVQKKERSQDRPPLLSRPAPLTVGGAQ